MAYDGTVDDDSPVHGSAISFNVREFLHIKVSIFAISSIHAFDTQIAVSHKDSLLRVCFEKKAYWVLDIIR